MKTQDYLKFLQTETEALDWMRLKNRARRAAGNRELLVVTEGPEDNWAVMDIRSAIELGAGYKWEAA